MGLKMERTHGFLVLLVTIVVAVVGVGSSASAAAAIEHPLQLQISSDENAQQTKPHKATRN